MFSSQFGSSGYVPTTASPFCEQLLRHPAEYDECSSGSEYIASVYSDSQVEQFVDQFGVQSSQPFYGLGSQALPNYSLPATPCNIDATSANDMGHFHHYLAAKSQLFGTNNQTAQNCFAPTWLASADISEQQQQQPRSASVNSTTLTSNISPQDWMSYMPITPPLDPDFPTAEDLYSILFAPPTAQSQSAADDLAYPPNQLSPPAVQYPQSVQPIDYSLPRSTFDSKKQTTLRFAKCQCPNCQEGGINNLLEPGDKRRHICHVVGCGKTYSNTSHLKAHLRWHIDETRYPCSWPQCGKTFKRSDDLQRHSKTHSGKKKYLCLYCDKRFVRSDHFNKHVRSHEKPRRQGGKKDAVPQLYFDYVVQ